MKHSAEELENKARAYRLRFLDIFTRLGFGHLTSAFSWAEVATVLYQEILRLPSEGESFYRCDKMVVSKGHGAGILFPIFEDLGLLRPKELEECVRIGGSNERLRQLFYPGFDFYGGSLGIGIGVACGLAKGAKLAGEDWRTFCVLGDAECCEGSVWEAALFAGHQGLNNLVAIVDRNGLGCSDFTEHMLKLEPLADKWRDCGWNVWEIDGHDVRMVYAALKEATETGAGKPRCIIARTRKGQGLEYLTNRPLMHGYMPKDEAEIARAYRELRAEVMRESEESGK